MPRRPTWAETRLGQAVTLSRRATCKRRQVGCILEDAHHVIIGEGYNGPASGLPHCIDIPCEGANMPSGTGLDACQAIHAEQNALIKCRDHRAIKYAYITCSPCITCVKMLLGTGCEEIVFLEEYPHPAAKKLWTDAGRKWMQHGTDEQ